MRSIGRQIVVVVFLTSLILTGCAPVAELPAPTAEVPEATEAPTAAPTEAPPEAEQAPVVVTVSMYGDEAAINRVYTVLEGVTAQYPYISVEVQAIADAEWYEKMMTQIAAGTAPDVMYISSTHAPAFFERDALLDLGPYIDDSEIGIDTGQFYPEIYEVGKHEGKPYLLAPDFATLATYINTDMFDAAGIPYPEEGWTYDDLVDICQELTLDANGNNAKSPDFDPDSIVQWGADQASPWAAYYDLLSPLWFSYNAFTISPDGTRSTGYMDTEEMAQAIEFYRDLIHKYHCAPTAASTEAQGGGDLFGPGLSAIKLNWGPWTLESYLENPDLNFATVPMPTGPAGHKNFAAWMGFGVYKDTEHPEEAYLVVRELGTEPGVRAHAVKSLAPIPAVNESMGKADDPYWSQFVQEIPYALAPEGMRSSKFAECVMAPFTAQISDVVVSEDGADFDPRPVLAELAQQADSCLAGD